MKLTKKARAELTRVLVNAERGQAYIDRPDVRICVTTKHPLTRDYTTPSGEGLRVIEKRAGSDLCGIPSAIELLAAFLDAN